MSLKIQKQKLQMIANDFYRGTGIQLSVLDAERCLIASAGLSEPHFCDIIQGIDGGEACRSADSGILDRCTLSRKPEMHICHAGLIDIAVPIIYEEKICGFIIMGRMRRGLEFDRLANTYDKFRECLCEKYDALPIYSEERAMSILSLASMLASYIITEDMIVRDNDTAAELIARYVRENLNRRISVADICRHMGISKNTLNRTMRKAYGVSMGEYILNMRMELACKLLQNTDDTVSSICEQTGFCDTSYFCKMFKKSVGMSPARYRKTS